MDLNELKSQITAQADDVQAKRKEVRELRDKLTHTVSKNIDSVLKPWLEESNGLLDVLYKKAGSTPNFEEIKDEVYHKSGTYSRVMVRASVWRMDVVIMDVVIYDGYSSSDSQYVCGGTNLSQSHLEVGAGVFLTEEDTQKFIDNYLIPDYIKVLEAWEQFLRRESASLADTIAKYKEQLSKAHTVQQNEDGTVEIQLGGKTYIGHVKEA